MTIGRIPSVEGGIQPTIVDAKGDLIAAVAADSVNRLAVGSNDQVLVADSGTSTGLAWKSYGAQFVAGKNKIINGDFGVWQRGTSFTTGNGAYVYTSDRWVTYFYGNNTTSVTRQSFTAGSAPVAGYEGQFFTRVNSTNTQVYFAQFIEDVRTFAGQTVTVSFWAKAASAATLTLNLVQQFGSGGSTLVSTSVNRSITTSWDRYTWTLNVPSISGKTIGTNSHLDLEFVFGTNNNLDLWGVQVEAGSVATPFTTATGTIQGELAACQRYYYRITNDSNTSYAGLGVAGSATLALVNIPLKSTMRVTPTSVDYASLRLYDLVNAASGVTAVALGTSSPQVAQVEFTTTGLTTYRPYFIIGNTTPSYIGFSAEL
jgi:hypothetical protein